MRCQRILRIFRLGRVASNPSTILDRPLSDPWQQQGLQQIEDEHEQQRC